MDNVVGVCSTLLSGARNTTSTVRRIVALNAMSDRNVNTDTRLGRILKVELHIQDCAVRTSMVLSAIVYHVPVSNMFYELGSTWGGRH